MRRTRRFSKITDPEYKGRDTLVSCHSGPLRNS
jgi:hypothetical protein